MNSKTQDVIFYLCLVFFIFLFACGIIDVAIQQPILKIAIISSLLGGVGSVVYCMRGVYLHQIKNNDHDSKFDSWFYLRPFVGMFRGFICSLSLLMICLLIKKLFPGDGVDTFEIIWILFICSSEGYRPFITKFLLP